MSCSDDQTIRIWNWQSRQNVAILTGHSHYVMCAQFHPKEDLVASASLDQSVRIWDISGIRRKYLNPTAGGNARRPYDDRSLGQIDLFGAAEGSVKFIIQHEQGVNWVSFHPTKNVLYTGSDDKTIRVWTLSSIQALNYDNIRGHTSHITCLLVPSKNPNLLISTSEDRTLRVWDVSKRGATCIIKHQRDKDRFWIIAAHPDQSLFAAGHDSGLIVFKLEHERIPLTVHMDTLYYVRDRKSIHAYHLRSGSEEAICLMEQKINLPALLSFVPSENRFLLSSASPDGTFQVIPVETHSKVLSGFGSYATHVSRGRFAVLDSSSGHIRIVSSTDNSPLRTIQSPVDNLKRLLPSVPGQAILVTEKDSSFYDFGQERIIASFKTVGCQICCLVCRLFVLCPLWWSRHLCYPTLRH